MTTVDFHTHIYPKFYLDFYEKREAEPKLINDPNEGLVFVHQGVRIAHVDPKGHVDPEYRIKVFDESGIEVQAVSLTTPSFAGLDKQTALKMAKQVNDHFAEIQKRYPENYVFLAALPLQDVGASLDEINRCIRDLGFRGIGLFTNVDGTYIDDTQFHPIFDKAVGYDVPVFVHPATPMVADFLKKYHVPVPLWGYTYESTILLTRMAWNGVLEKFPNLKLVTTHLGGFVPFQLERINYAYRGYSRELGYKPLPRMPSDYLKQVYYDAVNFYKPAVELVHKFVGGDHVLMGTDYAHRVGDPRRAVPNIKELDIPEEDKLKILGGNAVKLLKME